MQSTDLTFEEKLQAAGFVGKAFVSFFVPVAVCAALRLDNVMAWFDAQAPFAKACVYLPAWVVSFIVVAGVLRGLLSFAENLCESASYAVDAVANTVANLLNLAFYGTLSLGTGAVKLALHPPRVLCEFVWDMGRTQIDLLLVSWRENAARLRRI